MSIEIRVFKLDPNAVPPKYAHTGPFGDLAADLYSLRDEAIEPSQIVSIRTGIALEFPPDFGALIEDRSSIALRGITTLAGVIDPGYRGEVLVVLYNLSQERVVVRGGERIAQLRIVKRVEASFVETSEIRLTDRGGAGFGSTGS